MRALFSEKKVFLDDKNCTSTPNKINSFAFQVKLMQYGFMFNEKDLDKISKLPSHKFNTFTSELLTLINKELGVDRNWTPMYPNFPNQVEDTSELELFINAIKHYWSFGQWKVESDKTERPVYFPTSFKQLSLINVNQLQDILTSWLEANVSLNDIQKSDIEFYFNYLETHKTLNISFKETLAFLALIKPKFAIKQCKTPTDVLRVASAWSNGDYTLKENTKFNLSLKQKQRVAKQLQKLILIEKEEFSWDMAQNVDRWQKLFHHIMLHKNFTDDYFKELRHFGYLVYNKMLNTFDSEVELLIKNKKPNKLITLLSKKQGVFVRRLNEILTKFPEHKLDKFVDAIDFNKLPNRILWQLYTYFNNRNSGLKRIINLPTGKRKVIDELPTMSSNLITTLQSKLMSTLKNRYKNYEVGNVSEDMKYVPLPLYLRGDTSGTLLPKGTRIPFGKDSKIVRFGVHWFNAPNRVDIDLSSTLFNSDFTMDTSIGWNANLKEAFALFSGDVTDAPKPNGACEFIDIDVDKAIKNGYQYVTIKLNLFSGEDYKQAETKFNIQLLDTLTDNETMKELGQSGNAFEPSRVIHSVDVNSMYKENLTCMIDLINRHVIWLDIPVKRELFSSGVQSVDATSILINNLINKKEASLYDLLKLFKHNKDMEDVSWETNAPYKISEYLKYF